MSNPVPGHPSAGIVLAGGRSRRFGTDKRLAVVDGRPLLEGVVEAVAGVVDDVIVVLAPDEPAPGGLTAVRIAHDREPFAGPLAGLAAGLEVVPDASIALVVGADMPSLQPAVLRLMLKRAAAPVGPDAWTLEGPDANLVGPLPLAGRVAPLRRAASALLERGQRSLRSLVLELGAGRIPAADWRPLDPDGLTLRDVDRPEDLREG